MSTLTVTVFQTPDATVVRLEGQAGFRSTDVVETPLQRVLATRPPLVIFDMKELDFMASLFIRQLITFRRGMNYHNGRIQLAAVQPAVLEVLRSSGLTDMFEYVPEAPQPPAE